METGDLIKYGLIGVGAYLVYEYFTGGSVFGISSPFQPAQPAAQPIGTSKQIAASTTAPVVTTTAPPTTEAPAAVPGADVSKVGFTASNLLAYVKAHEPNFSGTLTADSWNYYVGQMTGVPQSVDLFPPDNRLAPLSIDAYMANRRAAGLGGIVDMTPELYEAMVPWYARLWYRPWYWD